MIVKVRIIWAVVLQVKVQRQAHKFFLSSVAEELKSLSKKDFKMNFQNTHNVKAAVMTRTPLLKNYSKLKKRTNKRIYCKISLQVLALIFRPEKWTRKILVPQLLLSYDLLTKNYLLSWFCQNYQINQIIKERAKVKSPSNHNLRQEH